MTDRHTPPRHRSDSPGDMTATKWPSHAAAVLAEDPTADTDLD